MVNRNANVQWTISSTLVMVMRISNYTQLFYNSRITLGSILIRRIKQAELVKLTLG